MLDVVPLPELHLHVSPALSLRATKWRYRGEGNANLVIALPQQREIMRLRKAERGKHVEPASSDQVEIERERVWREVAFCQRVMVPLVGSCYLQPPMAARLDSSEVRHIRDTLQSQRPAHRHHKEVLCEGGHVTLHPDYALLPATLADPDPQVTTFCVEVKPKQGWLPQPDRQLFKCTFCMKQYLKLKNKSILRRSGYCPLDLFSGDMRRMHAALQALLASPQNNLKIFKNGVLVYGESLSTMDRLYSALQSWFGTPPSTVEKLRLVNKFCSVVLEALTRDLSSGSLEPLEVPESSSLTSARLPQIASQGYILPSANADLENELKEATPMLPTPCDWRYKGLPVNCVLDRILRIQMLENAREGCELPTSPRSRKDYSYVATVIRDPDTFQSPLHRYLLSATAKDCSLLLAFQSVSPERSKLLPQRHISCQAGSGQLFVFNVGVSDLDPKPLSCIEKHRQRDMDMLMACLELAAKHTEA